MEGRTIPKSWQIFYRELKENGEWWTGKRPIRVWVDREKAEKHLSQLKKNAGINQDYVMVEVNH